MTTLSFSSPSSPGAAFGAEYKLSGTVRKMSPDRQHPHYWPCDMLRAFTLQMAASGQCINISMMLGSREYAIEKLNCAHSLGNDQLRELAVTMFSYFDDEPCHAVAQFVASDIHH
jgi:hypothetical protein